MAWETFRGRNRRLPGQPAISVTKVGSIGLNATVVRDYVGKARFATLMFDPDKSLIGIKLTDKADEGSYPIKKAPKDNYALISGVSFLKAYGIFPKESANYSATFDEKNRIIIANVSELVGKTSKKDKN